MFLMGLMCFQNSGEMEKWIEWQIVSSQNRKVRGGDFFIERWYLTPNSCHSRENECIMEVKDLFKITQRFVKGACNTFWF